VYSEEDVSQLETAMCLKSTGMPLKEIKRYFQLVQAGDATLDQRLDIFKDHRERVLEEIRVLHKHLEKIDHKIGWYQSFVRERQARTEEE